MLNCFRQDRRFHIGQRNLLSFLVVVILINHGFHQDGHVGNGDRDVEGLAFLRHQMEHASLFLMEHASLYTSHTHLRVLDRDIVSDGCNGTFHLADMAVISGILNPPECTRQQRHTTAHMTGDLYRDR